MISREEGMALVEKHLKKKNLVKHVLAVEAIMRKLAGIFGEDVELWGITGLLHDLDYEFTKKEPEKHASMSADILKGLLPQEAVNAIKAHNYQHTSQVPETALDKALIAADAVSGLIIATALVIPSRKLADVQLKTLINKYKDNSFARGCNRKRIELCEDIDISRDDFLAMSLVALQGISKELEL